MKYIVLGILTLTALPTLANIKVDMLSDKVDRLDREMTLLQQRVYRPQSSENKTTAMTPTTAGEIEAQLDAQNQVIQDLTRQLEELTHAHKQLQEQLNRLNADVDLRFKEQSTAIETAKESIKTSAMKSQADTPPQPTKKPDMEQLKKRDKTAYDAAYDLLRKNKYAEAENAFRSFMTEYPDSSLVGNANYWLGETYYVRGNYETAAGIFADGFTKYGSNSKAPDNLLKLGLTMSALGKKEEACTALLGLSETFPKASDSLKKRAADEAEKIKCPTN